MAATNHLTPTLTTTPYLVKPSDVGEQFNDLEAILRYIRIAPNYLLVHVDEERVCWFQNVAESILPELWISYSVRGYVLLAILESYTTDR